jgi:hypothetical protein
MRMKTKNYKRTEKGSRQESSHEQFTENGNHTEETQKGPAPAPTNIGITTKQGNKYNKRIRWSKEEMKEVVWCIQYVKETTSTENYKAAYELWRKRNLNLKTSMDVKLLLNQKNYILKNKKITDTEINEIMEDFRPRMQDNTEDQLREEQTNNVHTTEEHLLLQNRNLGEDTQQHVAGEKLKEETEMWYKVRLLQMSERQRMPKLIGNNKIIRLKKETNGIIEELVKENETDITDLNHLIYAAATVITEKVTKPGKTAKSRRNKNSWKIRIQTQISN